MQEEALHEALTLVLSFRVIAWLTGLEIIRFVIQKCLDILWKMVGLVL